MSMSTLEQRTSPAAPWKLPLIWVSATTLLGLLWVAGVLVPYYVNGLDRLSVTALTSGAWDPAQLWPADTGPVGRAVQAAGALVGWPLMYLVHIGSTLGSAYLLKDEWSASDHGQRALLIANATLSAALTGVLLSPFGIALSEWAMD